MWDIDICHISLLVAVPMLTRVYMQDINGRNVTLLSHGGQIYAFDSVCYHMGGPLGAAGDIEELGSHLVISCPWHHRKVPNFSNCKSSTSFKCLLVNMLSPTSCEIGVHDMSGVAIPLKFFDDDCEGRVLQWHKYLSSWQKLDCALMWYLCADWPSDW